MLRSGSISPVLEAAVFIARRESEVLRTLDDIVTIRNVKRAAAVLFASCESEGKSKVDLANAGQITDATIKIESRSSIVGLNN